MKPSRQLTEKEKEILLLVLEGMTTKEIGEKLSITIRTVDTHIHRILEKKQSPNRYRLIADHWKILANHWRSQLPNPIED